jgi:hypothetical protein
MNKGCCQQTFLAPIIPYRSTFCFKNDKRAYLSYTDIITLKRQWNMFEKVENNDSIAYSTIIGGGNDSFYIFNNQSEKLDYNLGRLNHIAEYPNYDDFLTPYSKRQRDNIKSVNSIIGDSKIFRDTETCCPNFDRSNVITNNELLRNTTARNLYFKVSTQKAMFPKTPYKFSGNDEYLLYKTYEQALC